MADKPLTIGKSELRKDAWDKVTGAAEYVADVPLDDVAHGAVIRSPHHYARILNIDVQTAEGASGVLRVLTAADIPGAKTFGALIQDQPSLAVDVVRHLGEPVALVVAEFALLVGSHHVQHVLFLDVAQQVFGFHEVVAGIQITVVFQSQGIPAGRAVDA